jgi:fumarylacetoacetate (FAA) hydrolase
MLYGQEDEVPYPSYTKALDYELEVACIIGKGGTNIREEEAETHIAGYTIMNDWSARDIQQPEMKIGLGPAKAKDFATSLGPWIVTPDELQDRKSGPARFDLRMKAAVNGKQLSDGNMKRMHWTFSQMIARASQSVELKVGEVFGSGTVGSGSLLELGQEAHAWLEPGDSVELEVERLGVLRNRIIETASS